MQVRARPLKNMRRALLQDFQLIAELTKSACFATFALVDCYVISSK